ncbi:Membrane protein involved in the export of O-antigen and teichoic acid [Halopelagius inordinatus]|uniref:Membrane protein involved in the export of O-antigen and teichoic acid n=1 Tax=Halopelagius inordinatus TaxID=553467 RepID=A0A1I2PN70_9EURY|nr:flippase [Halopelagius inordinatus]SFG17582.1 Membrane protein involved in the export of O-antigen and teichoic acid [Halopelagius inordinatus]
MADGLDSTFRSLFKGGGLVIIGMGIELGTAFIAKLFMARILGVSSYGGISIGTTLITFASMLTVLGLQTGAGRFLPRYDTIEDKKGIIVSAIQIVGPVSLVIGGVLFASSGYLATNVFDDSSLTPILQIASITVPFAAFVTLAVGVLQGTEEVMPKVIMKHVSLPVVRFGLIITVLALGLGTVGLISAFLAAYVVAAAVGLVYLYRRTSLGDSGGYTTRRKELLLFSLPLSISGAMTLVFSHVDTFMVGWLATVEDVGIYGVVYPLASMLSVTLTSFGFIFLPVFSKYHSNEDADGMRSIYTAVAKWILFAACPLFVLFFFFPELTISLTFGAKYSEGALALRILSISFFFHAIVGPNSKALVSMGCNKAVMYYSVLVAVVNLVLNFLLIPGYSYVGASVATTLSYGLLNVLNSTKLYRVTGILPQNRVMLPPVTAATLSIGAIELFVRPTFPERVVVQLGFAVLYVLLLTVFIARFGGIEEHDLKIVSDIEHYFGVDLSLVRRFVNVK